MSQVARLAADMAGAGERVVPKVRRTMSKGALNVKKDMANEMLAFRLHPNGTHERIARDISYEFTGPLQVEIGATLGDVGSVQLLYFGNSKVGPTAPDPIRSARKEANSLERYIADAGEESVW